MESSTSRDKYQWLEEEDEWKKVLSMLPHNLSRSAHKHGALLRRRGISTASDLLRLAFFYSLIDWSLRQVGLWATVLGICELSDVAILNRLRASRAWLGVLVMEMLGMRGIQMHTQTRVRLRIMDATVISLPGSCGTDWRLHLSVNLEQMSLDHVEITDYQGGEGFGNFPIEAEDILLADSAYGHPKSIEKPLLQGAKVVVREQWNTRPVYNQNGAQIDIIGWLHKTFPDGSSTPVEVPVWIPTSQGLRPMRMIACPLPPDKAEQARKRAYRRSTKKGHTPSPKNLYAAGFVILLTNLSTQEWSLDQVLELYRWRWQIEMYIKRLKSLLSIDHLRSKDPELVQTYLLTKLLAAMLIDQLRTGRIEQVPQLFDSPDRPLSVWLLDQSLIQLLTRWVIGDLPDLTLFDELLPSLTRYLCGSPRKRRQQLAIARSQLASLCVC